MFQAPHGCTLVKGTIFQDDVCDEWYPEDGDAATKAKRGGPGNPDALRRWFTAGAGGRINWGSEGDFEQCVTVASEHMDTADAQGFCQLRHQEATGMATATHAARERKK